MTSTSRQRQLHRPCHRRKSRRRSPKSLWLSWLDAPRGPQVVLFRCQVTFARMSAGLTRASDAIRLLGAKARRGRPRPGFKPRGGTHDAQASPKYSVRGPRLASIRPSDRRWLRDRCREHAARGRRQAGGSPRSAARGAPRGGPDEERQSNGKVKEWRHVARGCGRRGTD